MTVPTYPINADIEMDTHGAWPASVHCLDMKTAAALRAAEAAGRPLLIRGRPGVGKSQTARAAAAAAGRTFLSFVIDGRTEPHDMMWHFDAVRRLAHAQQQSKELSPERNYLRPQVLWWAFDWAGAAAQARRVGMASPTIPTDALLNGTDRAVVLIDEIDKADPELPNALLEVLGSQGFSIPHGTVPVTCNAGNRPLVILTTNEERELPAAFLRRCLVITLQLPTKRDDLVAYLVDLGTRHQRFLIARGLRTRRCSASVMRQAATDLADRRDEVGEDSGLYAPGTAEYLDMLGALATLWPDNEAEQLKQLKLLGEFTLYKDQP